MRRTRLIMGMPVTVLLLGPKASNSAYQLVFDHFHSIDRQFSPYKKDSELARVNAGLPESLWSDGMRQILHLCEQTRLQTNGYFNIMHSGQRDPSGLVKGWAIHAAAELLHRRGINNFYIDAGGDIQTSGYNRHGKKWRVGIRNPFNHDQIVKTIEVSNQGVATSGTAIRGQHIYNPLDPDTPLTDIVSITVIGRNIYEADRFATAAFAMGRSGAEFIERLSGLEAYIINSNGIATSTSGLSRYVAE